MTKQEAADIFGGVHAELARALDMTRGGISQWPDELTESQQDRVIGAAIRLGKTVPECFRKPRDRAANDRSQQVARGTLRKQMHG